MQCGRVGKGSTGTILPSADEPAAADGGLDGAVLGEEVLRVVRNTDRTEATTNATLTNGMARSGCIPDDASFGKDTFEVLSSRLQPGCAESSIVNGILGLIDGSRPTTH